MRGDVMNKIYLFLTSVLFCFYLTGLIGVEKARSDLNHQGSRHFHRRSLSANDVRMPSKLPSVPSSARGGLGSVNDQRLDDVRSISSTYSTRRQDLEVNTDLNVDDYHIHNAPSALLNVPESSDALDLQKLHTSSPISNSSSLGQDGSDSSTSSDNEPLFITRQRTIPRRTVAVRRPRSFFANLEHKFAKVMNYLTNLLAR